MCVFVNQKGLRRLTSQRGRSRDPRIELRPILPEQVKVYRDVIHSAHEDLQFMTRVRTVSRHLARIFERDNSFLNEF